MRLGAEIPSGITGFLGKILQRRFQSPSKEVRASRRVEEGSASGCPRWNLRAQPLRENLLGKHKNFIVFKARGRLGAAGADQGPEGSLSKEASSGVQRHRY